MLLPFGQLHAATRVPDERVQSLDHGINIPNLLQEGNKFNTFTNDDLGKLKAMGIRNVRIPVEIGFVLPGFMAPGLQAPSTDKDVSLALGRLDKFVDEFVKAGFPVTLALFMPQQFVKEPVDQSKALMLQAVGVLTSRYAANYNPDQVLFDVNEPHYDAAAWNEIAPALVAAVREKAPLHTIIVESVRNGINFIQDLKPVDDPNVIYAIHVYWPPQLTMQGQPGQTKVDPSIRFPDGNENDAELEKWLHKGIDWAASNKVPLILQEFGCCNLADPPSRAHWISSMRGLAEKNHLPWTYWAFSGKIFGLKRPDGTYDPLLVKCLGPSTAP
jgi:endoglucanase